jgi:hypothetical protein
MSRRKFNRYRGAVPLGNYTYHWLMVESYPRTKSSMAITAECRLRFEASAAKLMNEGHQTRRCTCA